MDLSILRVPLSTTNLARGTTHYHYKVELPVGRRQDADILERIAIDEDKVRIVTWLDLPQLVGVQHEFTA